MAKKDLIKQARCSMLRSLERVYPSGLNCKYLFQVLCSIDEVYDIDLMRKDIAYLREKGYVKIVSLSGKDARLADVKMDSLTVIKLTAQGLDIAQDMIDDPALEI
jgi:hypothetical protein